MAGDRQAASGAGFDPSPQFWVDEVVGFQPLTVTGRCWFAPVGVGTVFDTVAIRCEDGSWKPGPCCLHVGEIDAYGQPFDELDQTTSAHIVLHGATPHTPLPESVLVSLIGPEAKEWQLMDGLWVRVHP